VLKRLIRGIVLAPFFALLLACLVVFVCVAAICDEPEPRW